MKIFNMRKDDGILFRCDCSCSLVHIEDYEGDYIVYSEYSCLRKPQSSMIFLKEQVKEAISQLQKSPYQEVDNDVLVKETFLFDITSKRVLRVIKEGGSLETYWFSIEKPGVIFKNRLKTLSEICVDIKEGDKILNAIIDMCS